MADDKKRNSRGKSTKGSAKRSSKSSGTKSSSKRSYSGGSGSSDSAAMRAGRAVAKKIGWTPRIIITLIVGVLLGLSMIWETQINVALGLTKQTEKANTTGRRTSR